MQSRFESHLRWYATCGKINPSVRLSWKISTNMYGAEEGSTLPKHKIQTGGRPWAVWPGESLGDFIELYSSVETSLALLSCSPGSNPIYCGIPLVEKSFFLFTIHANYFEYLWCWRRLNIHETEKLTQKREESLGLYVLESYSAISLSSIAQWKLCWCSGHTGQGSSPIHYCMPLSERSLFTHFSPFMTNIFEYLWCWRRLNVGETEKLTQTRGEP